MALVNREAAGLWIQKVGNFRGAGDQCTWMFCTGMGHEVTMVISFVASGFDRTDLSCRVAGDMAEQSRGLAAEHTTDNDREDAGLGGKGSVLRQRTWRGKCANGRHSIRLRRLRRQFNPFKKE